MNDVTPNADSDAPARYDSRGAIDHAAATGHRPAEVHSPGYSATFECGECVTPPGGWPFGPESACRLIAATGNPNERKENRDAWAVTMLYRPDVLAIEIDRARKRLEQAIALVQSSVLTPGRTDGHG